MAFNDLFVFKSRKQSAEDSRQYERKIFPFGQDQKDEIQQFLRENVRCEKANERETFYQYVVIRQLMAEDRLEEGYGQWYHSGIGKLFSHREKAFIRAYAALQSQRQSADEPIDLQQLRQLADELEKQDAPTKPRKRILRF